MAEYLDKDGLKHYTDVLKTFVNKQVSDNKVAIGETAGKAIRARRARPTLTSFRASRQETFLYRHLYCRANGASSTTQEQR